MNRLEAKKWASEYSKKLCQTREQSDTYYAAYLQCFDDLKEQRDTLLEVTQRKRDEAYEIIKELQAKLREVPWTEDDIQNELFKISDNGRHNGFQDGIEWAEKRIKERG